MGEQGYRYFPTHKYIVRMLTSFFPALAAFIDFLGPEYQELLELRRLVQEQEQKIEQQSHQLRQQQAQIENLTQALLHARKKLFGPSTEVTNYYFCTDCLFPYFYERTFTYGTLLFGVYDTSFHFYRKRGEPASNATGNQGKRPAASLLCG